MSPKNKIVVKTLSVVFIVIMIYAFFRYNIGKDIPFEWIPTFIVNKALSMTAISGVATAYILSSLGKFKGVLKPKIVSLKKNFGLAGFFVAVVHVVFSLSQLGPVRYGKLFNEDGMVNPSGELTILLGLFGFICLMFPAYASLPEAVKQLGPKNWLRVQRVGYLTLGLILGHTAAMGAKQWVDPSLWPFYMPPISLIGGIIAASALILRFSTFFRKR